MPSTPSTNLRLELQATGEALNLWGERLNTVISLMEEALVGKFTKALTTSYTLTSTNYVSDEARAFGLFFTDGGLSGVPTITIPAAKKTYLVSNGGSTYNINISCGGTAAAVRPGQKSIVYCDATDCYVLDPTLDKINKAAADVDINSHKLTNVTDPTSAQHAATKNYVDTKTLDTFTAPAADVTLNSHKITNLADATANTDAMNKQSVTAQIASATVNMPVQTGNANKVLTTDGTTPAWSVASVQGGGTGAATLAAHGVVIGNGTSAVNVTGAGTSGQPLVSNGGSADPTYQTLPISGGGTGQVTAAAARGSSGLNIEGATGHGDSIYTILATDRYVYTNAAFTGSRTWTLPAANAVNPGQGLIISDLQGTLTNTNTLVVARAGSDTINGASSVTLDVAYGAVELISDGSSKWFARRLLPYGTSANQTLRLDSSGKIPAVDGSQITGIAASTWTLVSSVSPSAAAASIDFTSISGANDLLLEIHGLVPSTSTALRIGLSTNGGGTYTVGSISPNSLAAFYGATYVTGLQAGYGVIGSGVTATASPNFNLNGTDASSMTGFTLGSTINAIQVKPVSGTFNASGSITLRKR